MQNNSLILADEQYYDMDCYKTKVNNNVLVVGASGSGKTRNILIPNLLQASGSYIVSDPKGNLYGKYKQYLEQEGYEVKKVDFIHPAESIGYNPFSYIKCEQDIIKIAHILTDMGGRFTKDPFWDQATELLFSSLISYLWEMRPKEEHNFRFLQRLIEACEITEGIGNNKNTLDKIMDEAERRDPSLFSVRQYKKFRIAADRTLKSILITANTKIGILDTKEMCHMLKDDKVGFASIGEKKTAVFVVVSDTDRSMDTLANLFFSQAISELCRYADEKCMDSDNRLPIDVRFILDDFATNVTICDFPRMIASIRSRGISVMLMIQSEGQLEKTYAEDGKTIIGNCDTYIYLGGNDVDTAHAVARRCDIPLKKILNMPVGECWIFRRGQEPVNAKLFDLEQFKKKKCEEEIR